MQVTSEAIRNGTREDAGRAVSQLRAIVAGREMPDDIALLQLCRRAAGTASDPALALDHVIDLYYALFALGIGRVVEASPEDMEQLIRHAAQALDQVEAARHHVN